MLKNGLAILVVALLLSCSGDKEQLMENPTQIDQYFRLKDFVMKQVDLLEGSTVRKTLGIKGEVETMEVQMDAEAWRKELDVFIQNDINKASLATAYETKEKDGVTTHELKPGEKSSVQEIKVTYENEKVKNISFKSRQDDFFYWSTSAGELKVDTESGKIDTYQVTGTQNVWFLPPNEMVIEGVILP